MPGLKKSETIWINGSPPGGPLTGKTRHDEDTLRSSTPSTPPEEVLSRRRRGIKLRKKDSQGSWEGMAQVRGAEDGRIVEKKGLARPLSHMAWSERSGEKGRSRDGEKSQHPSQTGLGRGVERVTRHGYQGPGDGCRCCRRRLVLLPLLRGRAGGRQPGSRCIELARVGLSPRDLGLGGRICFCWNIKSTRFLPSGMDDQIIFFGLGFPRCGGGRLCV
jgi:hypothetical protein